MKITQRYFGESFSPTIFILIINSVVYLIMTIISLAMIDKLESVVQLVSIHPMLLYFLGQNNYLVLRGWFFQLFTGIIVHVHLIHFASNSVFLLTYGLRAEERIRNKDYFLIYLLSALLGNILTLLLYDEMTISAGASGAIFGLLGIGIILAIEEDRSRSIWIYLGMGFIFLILTGGYNVNQLAHASGLVMGLFLTRYVFKYRKELKDENESVKN